MMTARTGIVGRHPHLAAARMRILTARMQMSDGHPRRIAGGINTATELLRRLDENLITGGGRMRRSGRRPQVCDAKVEVFAGGLNRKRTQRGGAAIKEMGRTNAVGSLSSLGGRRGPRRGGPFGFHVGTLRHHEHPLSPALSPVPNGGEGENPWCYPLARRGRRVHMLRRGRRSYFTGASSSVSFPPP